MERKIECNPEHKDADEQEMEFRMRFLEWSFEKRWNYLMELFRMGRELNPPPKTNGEKKGRRIEWSDEPRD